jgi:hypothetical protein
MTSQLNKEGMSTVEFDRTHTFSAGKLSSMKPLDLLVSRKVTEAGGQTTVQWKIGPLGKVLVMVLAKKGFARFRKGRF